MYKGRAHVQIDDTSSLGLEASWSIPGDPNFCQSHGHLQGLHGPLLHKTVQKRALATVCTI